MDLELQLELVRAAQKAGVRPELALGVMRAESGGKATAQSPKGAQGLMQLMPGTAREMGVTDPFDPLQNINGGVKYLKQMLDRFGGDETKALAAYNAGPGNVQKYGGIPPFQETQAYVQKILDGQPPRQAPAAQSVQAPPPAASKPGLINRPVQELLNAPAIQRDFVAEYEAQKAANANKGFLESAVDGVKNMIDDPVTHLPEMLGTVGGVAGGILGGVGTFGLGAAGGAVAGGAAGGALGEAARQFIEKYVNKDDTQVPSNLQDAFKSIVWEGGTQGVAELGGPIMKGVGKVLKTGARAAYSRALNPSALTLRSVPGYQEGAEPMLRKKLAEIGLENKAPVSAKGADQMAIQTRATRDQVRDVIAADPDRPIEVVPAIRPHVRAMGEDLNNQVSGTDDLKAAWSVLSDFLSHQKMQRAPAGGAMRQGARFLRGEDAQAIKVGTNKRVPHNEPKSTAKNQAKKTLNRGLKEALEKAYKSGDPAKDIKTLNARQAEEIALRKALGRASTRNPNSLADLVSGLGFGIGAGAGFPVAAALPIAYRIAQRPPIASRLAIKGWQGGKALDKSAAYASPALAALARALAAAAADED